MQCTSLLTKHRTGPPSLTGEVQPIYLIHIGTHENLYLVCETSQEVIWLLRQLVDFEHATKQFYLMYFMTRSQGVRAKKKLVWGETTF